MSVQHNYKKLNLGNIYICNRNKDHSTKISILNNLFYFEGITSKKYLQIIIYFFNVPWDERKLKHMTSIWDMNFFV